MGGAGGEVGLLPSTAVCGNGVLEPGERCEGDGPVTDPGTISCAELLGDPDAEGTPTCDRCFPSAGGCVSCRDGHKNGLETDLDCGGAGACARCTLGMACATNDDCSTGLTCAGSVCNEIRVELGVFPSHRTVGAAYEVPLIVRGALPIPETAVASVTSAAAGVSLLAAAGPQRLVAKVGGGSGGGGTSLALALDGQPVGSVALPDIPAHPASPVSNAITGVTANVGSCAFAGPAPPALATNAQGQLELPLGRPFCAHISFATPIAGNVTVALGGQALAKNVPSPQQLLDVQVTLPFGVPLFEAAPADTRTVLSVVFDDGSIATASAELVLSPPTIEAGATGLGTTSSPAGSIDFAALGAPISTPAVVQVKGAYPVVPQGFSVPSGVIVQGLDEGAALIPSGPAAPLTVTLAEDAGLRDLAVQGPSAADDGGPGCVVVSGVGASLFRAPVAGCDIGVRVKAGASLRMVGTGTNDDVGAFGMTGVFGEAAAAVHALGVGFVGTGLASTALDGFVTGDVTLVRPVAKGVGTALNASGGAVEVRGGDLTAEVAPAVFRKGASATLVGTTLRCSGAGNGKGLDGTALGVADLDTKVTARGIVAADCAAQTGQGVAVALGSVDLVASTLSHSGGAVSPALSVNADGSLIAHAVRIDQPGQIGVMTSKDAKSVDLTGVVVEPTTFRGVWIFGGTATLRTVQILEPGRAGLAYGDPAGPLKASDVDIVSHQPLDGLLNSLVFADRAAAVGDELSFHTLVAGAGQVLQSVEGSPLCSTKLIDPVGGTYLVVNAGSQAVCF